MAQVNEQTSARVSAIAARILQMTDADMEEVFLTESDVAKFCKDIRSLAASCLTQDETPQG